MMRTFQGLEKFQASRFFGRPTKSGPDDLQGKREGEIPARVCKPIFSAPVVLMAIPGMVTGPLCNRSGRLLLAPSHGLPNPLRTPTFRANITDLQSLSKCDQQSSELVPTSLVSCADCGLGALVGAVKNVLRSIARVRHLPT
jgi:hypothetical protein